MNSSDDSKPWQSLNRSYTSYITGTPGDYAVEIKLAFNAVAFVLLSFSAVSLASFQRTRNTPKTAKLLSSALILFDFCTTLSFALRKFITNQRLNIMINFIGIGWSFLAYINVALMSIERLVIFEWPNFYLRHVSHTVAKRLSVFIWISFSVCYLTQFFLCVQDQSYKGIVCLSFLAVDYIKIMFPLVAVISLVCFGIILAIIRKQTERNYQKNSGILRQSKPTLAVFVCVMSFILTTSVYICFSMIASFDVNVRRLILDALAMVNQFVDTCVYIVWYQETRLELMKMFSCLHPSMLLRAEQMKIQIFRIVTYDKTRVYNRFTSLVKEETIAGCSHDTCNDSKERKDSILSAQTENCHI